MKICSTKKINPYIGWGKHEGDMIFLGWTNFSVCRQIGQFIVYSTECWKSTKDRRSRFWIEVKHTLVFHTKVACGTQNLYYDITALVHTEQCSEICPWDITSLVRNEYLCLLTFEEENRSLMSEKWIISKSSEERQINCFKLRCSLINLLWVYFTKF